MDLKVMPRSYKGDRYILCVIDEVTNYIITTPMKQAKSEEVGEILINSVFSKYCVPDYIIMDLDSAFMSSLMSCLFKKLGIKIKQKTTVIYSIYFPASSYLVFVFVYNCVGKITMIALK